MNDHVVAVVDDDDGVSVVVPMGSSIPLVSTSLPA